MIRLHADWFIWSMREIEQTSSLIKNSEYVFDAESKKSLIEAVKTLGKFLRNMNCGMSEIGAERLFNLLQSTDKADNELKTYIDDLILRVQDELGTKFVFLISPEKEKYYNPDNPIFGKEVSAKFVDMNEDIAEAGNCFALGRYTACVFHLMRVMEKTVQKLADKLGIPLTITSDMEWQVIINEIRGQLKKLYPKHIDPDRVKYESVLGHLETVKIAWRNPTMHPKATYTEEEAKALLDTVRIFIKDLVKVL